MDYGYVRVSTKEQNALGSNDMGIQPAYAFAAFRTRRYCFSDAGALQNPKI